MLTVAAVASYLLLRHYGGNDPKQQLDAIRTAGTLVVGTGGAVALLLTARRQRYTELALLQTDRDATERRITELYTKAADQLGNEKAPVRLAGLHALERLAHNTPQQRQTIVDVICAYLRMPYTPPDEKPPAEDAPADAHTRYEERRQEQQVRLTAQNILTRNLAVMHYHRRSWWHRKPPPAKPAWPSIGLDLIGAVLINFSLTGCRLYCANFRDAQFTGKTPFLHAEFTGGAYFMGAQFIGGVYFRNAQFKDGVHFVGAQFNADADFEGVHVTRVADFGGVQFTRDAHFGAAQFNAEALFGDVQFTGGADFEGAQFADRADFRGAQFDGGAGFERAKFTGKAHFGNVQFTGGADFERAHFTDRADFSCTQFTGAAFFAGAQFARQPDFAGARVAEASGMEVWPSGWTTRPACLDYAEDPTLHYLVEVEGNWPTNR